jgi:hypothetical protein
MSFEREARGGVEGQAVARPRTRKRGSNEKAEISSPSVGDCRRLSWSATAAATTRVASSAASSFPAALEEVTRSETAL